MLRAAGNFEQKAMATAIAIAISGDGTVAIAIAQAFAIAMDKCGCAPSLKTTIARKPLTVPDAQTSRNEMLLAGKHMAASQLCQALMLQAKCLKHVSLHQPKAWQACSAMMWDCRICVLALLNMPCF